MLSIHHSSMDPLGESFDPADCPGSRCANPSPPAAFSLGRDFSETAAGDFGFK